MGRKANTVDRMLRVNVRKTDGCWHWTGKINNCGYGEVNIRGKGYLAHRVFHSHFNGPIPEGFQVDHVCCVRDCVNPAHLRAVSARENNLRSTSPAAINARKVACVRGHPLSGSNLYMTPDGRRQCRVCRGLAGIRCQEKAVA
jgi:hypothetical protein